MLLPPNSPDCAGLRTPYELVKGHHEELLRASVNARLLDELKDNQPARASLDRRVVAMLSGMLLRLSNRLAAYRKVPTASGLVR
jgi:hypothetical protein